MTNFSLKRSNTTHKYFNGIDLPAINEQEYKKYTKIFNDKYNTEYGEYNVEDLLRSVFDDYKGNKLFKGLYIKCVLLDKTYSTNIKYMNNLVYHISQIKNFEERINKGDISLVEEIKSVKKPDETTINYLSFASKFCSWSNPSAFPIYDTIVKDALTYYVYSMEELKEFKGINLNIYSNYKKVIDKIMQTYSFLDSYKKFDVYMWTMGKEKLQGVNLLKEINKGNNNKVIKKLELQENSTEEQLIDCIVKKYELN